MKENVSWRNAGYVLYCILKKGGLYMQKRKYNGPGIGKLLCIFLCVGAVFAALWFSFEWIGGLRDEDKPPDEPQEGVMENVPGGVVEGLAKNEYDLEAFAMEDGFCVYHGEPAATRGIDVSAHQGTIDWTAVASDGVEYAMIRVGYRGYTEGDTSLDELFYDNVAGALENGLQVGVYFFSQAITVQEAVEEAEIVLRAIEGLEVTYPVIFDWEDIPQEARTDGMDPVTLTDCAKAFCETIEAAGYRAGVYFNQAYGYQHYNLLALDDYVFWLAQYDSVPDFYYDFQMWQYTNTGEVAGITGDVDLNLSFWQPQ